LGTHGCIAITKSDGTHICCERTLDGYNSMDAIINWMRTGLKEEDYPAPDEIGYGAVEFNEEREHNQEYYYHVNYKTKTIGGSNIPVPTRDGNLTVSSIIMLIAEYIKQGWRYEIAWECEHEEVTE